MSRCTTDRWYLKGAENATKAYGEKAVELLLERWRAILSRESAAK